MTTITNNNLGMKPEDYEKIAKQVEDLKRGENMLYAILCGLGAAIISAFLWAFVTVGTGFQIGFMAIGVGFLVGQTIRYTGKGVTKKFGILGASLSILGCLLGNMLSIIFVESHQVGIPIFHALASVNYSVMPSIIIETFSVIDILFYGIAIYEGYRFSFKPLNEFAMLEKANENSLETYNN